MKQAAGLIFDDSIHYLDHLAPFCALQKWPLIICEEKIGELARYYYPELEVIEQNRWNISLPPLIIACDTRSWIDSLFGIEPSRKTFWLPHGNSDKGEKSSLFEPLQGETALVYGQKMVDFIQSKKVFPKIIRIGNFRSHYWKKHRLFYQRIIQKELSIPPKLKTYLYAPTWNDTEGNGLFWEIVPLLISHLPDDFNLIIKIHPNTSKVFGPEIERMIGKYKTHLNVLFLSEFPPVYPLFDICDAYIGDMSSIGYDFLFCNRPMFFIKKKSFSPFLYRSGIEVTPEEIPSIFKNIPDQYESLRQETYAYTFDPYRRPPFRG